MNNSSSAPDRELQSSATAVVEEEHEQGYEDGSVSEVVTTRVRAGKEPQYHAWAERIHKAEAQFPGYRGGFLQPPISTEQPYWTTLVRFASQQELDAWLDSEVRSKLLAEHDALVQSWEHHRLPSSFAGWFAEGASDRGAPPVWKQSMLVILMLFPVVMLELHFLRPLLAGINPSAGTFIANVISVSLLAWPLMPLIIGRMNWWLLPKQNSPRWVNAAGICLVTALYGFEILILSRL